MISVYTIHVSLYTEFAQQSSSNIFSGQYEVSEWSRLLNCERLIVIESTICNVKHHHNLLSKEHYRFAGGSENWKCKVYTEHNYKFHIKNDYIDQF